MANFIIVTIGLIIVVVVNTFIESITRFKNLAKLKFNLAIIIIDCSMDCTFIIVNLMENWELCFVKKSSENFNHFVLFLMAITIIFIFAFTIIKPSITIIKIFTFIINKAFTIAKLSLWSFLQLTTTVAITLPLIFITTKLFIESGFIEYFLTAIKPLKMMMNLANSGTFNFSY